MATFSLGLPALWLAVAGYLEARSSAHVSKLTMASLADQLADAVNAQWKAEARIRRLNDPYPLPVSWTAADTSLTDSWDSLVKLASSGAGWPPLAPDRTWAASLDELGGQGEEILTVLARIPTGRLVVLGEPGSGKTMLMVRLVLDLLARRAPGDPVPFLAPIASWDPPEQDLWDWLTAQLQFDHPALAAPPTENVAEPTWAAALLASGLILPILDGLDEMPETVRGPAIGRMNDALRPGERLVVTCRTRQYRDAIRPENGDEVTLRAAAAVQLLPLDADTVRDYLCDDAAGPVMRARWEPVFAVLGTEAPAGQALSTALMVGLARTIYNPRRAEQAGTLRDPAELCNPVRADRSSVEALLFDAFIPAAYRDGTTAHWNAQDAERWLVFLARRLEQTIGGPDLAWWQLQLIIPNFTFIAGIINGVVYGVVYGVTWGVVFKTIVGAVTAGVVASALVATVSVRMKWPSPVWGIWMKPPGRGTLLAVGLAGLVIVTGIFALSGAIGGTAGKVLAILAIVGLVIFIPAGFVFLISAQRGVPVDIGSALSPAATLEGDRRTVKYLAKRYGIVYGLVLGSVVWGIAGIRTGIAVCIVVGVAAGAVTSFEDGAWPAYELTQIWLALQHRLPRQLMDFLGDAHRRGVLRQVGTTYQFRHIELQHRLATREPELARIGSPFNLRDDRGGTYRVTLVKLTEPTPAGKCNMPDSGRRFVEATLRLRPLSGSLQETDISNTAAVIGSNGQTYFRDVANIARGTSISNGIIDVPQGKTEVVSLTFQVPEDVRVTKVQWTPGVSGYTVQWEVRRTWPASLATAIALQCSMRSLIAWIARFGSSKYI